MQKSLYFCSLHRAAIYYFTVRAPELVGIEEWANCLLEVIDRLRRSKIRCRNVPH